MEKKGWGIKSERGIYEQRSREEEERTGCVGSLFFIGVDNADDRRKSISRIAGVSDIMMDV